MIQIFLGDNMYLFKHNIRFTETRPYEEDVKFSNIEEARYLNHEYRVRKKENVGEENQYLLLWFERVSNGLKDGEKYYWEDQQTKEMEEISREQYDSLKREYNYFIVFDNTTNSIFSYNTSDSQKNILHKHLLKTFLEMKRFEVFDSVDLKELKEYMFNVMKLRYKNTKQTKFKLWNRTIIDDLQNDFASEFDFDELNLVFKNGKDIIKTDGGYEKFLKRISEDGADFTLEGRDKKGNPVKIENKKMHKKVSISRSDADHTKPDKIYEQIKAYFMGELDE